MTTQYENINPTEMKIRTMTIVCKMSHKIDFDIVTREILHDDIVVSIEYKKGGLICIKGLKTKGNVVKTKKKKNGNNTATVGEYYAGNILKKSAKDGKITSKKDKGLTITFTQTSNMGIFENQITMELILPIKTGETKRVINCKVFNNGQIHMTGCLSILHAQRAANIISEKIKKTGGFLANENDTNKTDFCVSTDDFSIKMINSNYRAIDYVDLDRYELYNVLTKNYDYLTKYEPENYPGIIIKYEFYQDEMCYYWTADDVSKWLESINCKECITTFASNNITGEELLKITHDGLKKMKIDNYDIRHKIMINLKSKTFLKLITIIIFRTGQIIITGGNSLAQVKSAYNFINDVIEKYFMDIIVLDSDDDSSDSEESSDDDKDEKNNEKQNNDTKCDEKNDAKCDEKDED